MPPTLLRKAFAEPSFVDTDTGGFEGYGSLFSVVDDGGDSVEKGAYTRTLPEFIKHGFIALGHDWAGEAIGLIDDAHEDERGLYIKATYHGTPAGQAARQIARERLAKGKSVGLSIGFRIAEGGSTKGDDGVRRLRDLDLFEISQVNRPLLRPAGLTSVKGNAADDDEDEPIGAPSGLKLAEHQERVCLWVPSVVARWRALVSPSEQTAGHEAKEGRAISTSRRERLGSLRDVLRSGADELDGLLVETAPPPPPSPEGAPKQSVPDGLALFAEYQRIAARLHGVAL